MVALVRYRPALLLGTVAASLWALALVLVGVATVTLSPSDAGTYNNLLTAAAWLDFAAALAVLAATASVAWGAVVRLQFDLFWEVGSLSVATLLFTIGFLLQAISAPNVSDAGFVVSAVGLGGWAGVLVVKAGRRSIEEQQGSAVGRQARFMLGGAGAVAVLAVALGLPSPSINDATLAVAGDVIYAAGFAALAVVLVGAHGRRMIAPMAFPMLAAGLWILAGASVVQSVLDGTVYGPPPISLSSLRSLSAGSFIEAVGFAVLAWAAFNGLAKLRPAVAPTTQLGVPPDHPGAPPYGDWPPATMVPPSWHPDPSGRHEFRWWDGVQWTEHVTDAGRASTDPPG